MILLGATPGAQSRRRSQISTLFGEPRFGICNDQPEARCRARLAYEAADSGLLSPELAAGIRRVKGVKHLGQRSGNWLTIDQAQLLVDKSDGDGLRNKRDYQGVETWHKT
jgi:hypothetical protein